MRVTVLFVLSLLTVACGPTIQNAVPIPCSWSGRLYVHGHEKQVHSAASLGSPGHVWAEGSWHLEGDANIVALPAANTVRIFCDRDTRTCTEAIALLYGRGDAKRVGVGVLEGLLEVRTEEYEILSWSDGLIRAVSRLIPADIELEISVTNQTAIRIHRERASETQEPVINSYLLR
jgi:hypothetical protein